jgi:uncharacterized oligopeptide transporter (OPT) family protein
MSVLAQAVVNNTMTWILIIAGMLLCLALILMGVKSPMLIFVGMYLPLTTVFAIFTGGLIKGLLDMYTKKKNFNETQLAVSENTGILLASGMIAGEALMGLIVAIFALFGILFSDLIPMENPSYLIGLAILVVIAFALVRIPLKRSQKI